MDARLSYQEAAVRGASPLRLVVLLYEQALVDLRHALEALERGDIETRTRAINHAILVIGHLQTSLDMGQGGEVARNLESFYGIVRNGLMEAQCRQSKPILQQQISLLTLVQEAWLEVERSSGPNENRDKPSLVLPRVAGGAVATEWSA
jgi:flagellar protein FliS